MNLSRQDKRITTVLFDLDDTLLDWSKRTGSGKEQTRFHMDKVHEYLAAEGHTLPDKETFFGHYLDLLIQSWDEAKKTWAGVQFGDVLSQCFVSIGLDLSEIDLNAVIEAYDWRPFPGVMPFEDSIPVLDYLRKHRYQIGLITNSMVPMWMRDIELRAYNLIDYFDVRITSGDTGYMKPHPAIYQRALNLLGAQAEQAVFVGDRPANDIAGANETGLVSVLMSPPHLNRELNGVLPDYTITFLSELMSILEGLERKEL